MSEARAVEASGAPAATTTSTHTVPVTATRLGRRRRPTGAPPPLPRHLGASGVGWAVALTVALGGMVLALLVPPLLAATDRVDAAVLRQFARVRAGWLTDVAGTVNTGGARWALTAAGLGVIVLLLVFRRWRHLFAWLGSIAVLDFVGFALYEAFSRPRPYGVTILGRWAGFSMPSVPVAILAAVLVGIIYTLVVPGRPRAAGKWVVGTVLGLFVAARLYLAIDHPSDALAGVALGITLPLLAFRLFTPNEAVPVAYRRGKTAHLDVGGARGEAIRRAVRDQLGLAVTDVRPVGLAGSGGSTPLRLTVAGDPDTYLFAKLYAMNHVRADRWYKLGRTILYGRLEDEAPFKSVRRLVLSEDHMLRLLRDAGIPGAAPYGVVEITPDREYLLVTEFFEGAQEIGDADVDDEVIDEGLELVRRLWDTGLAHRDIKPANLLVRDGHVLLIDVFFVQVRPSPWRQAVDLANMMLVLALRTDAERVYRRALRLFTPDELAEAFAATKGVASPSQLRAVMKQDGRDLLAQFRALAPPRPPISVQRWSVRRVALGAAVVVGAVFVAAQTASMLFPADDLGVTDPPSCGRNDVLVLVAQSVPDATMVPCLASLPAGWQLGGAGVRRDRATFWLDSDQAGERAVEVALRRPEECDVAGAQQVATDQVGTERWERPERLPPDLRTTRLYRVAGGCVTYTFDFEDDAPASLLFAADQALAFQSRDELVQEVRDRTDLALCGAGAPCPG